MNPLEGFFVRLRHHPLLQNSPVWNVVRPCYDILAECLAGGSGLERNLNGTDPIRVAPRWRSLSEQYEPDVWKRFMADVRQGDTVADVGAFIGVYAIAVAKRVGPRGSVVAFEPETTNFQWLKHHVALNHVGDRVRLVEAAAGPEAGEGAFVEDRDCRSHMAETRDPGMPPQSGRKVRMTTLDDEFPAQRVDLIKVDVEGFEEQVLRGGAHLLKDPARSPRSLYIEVHPFAWEDVRASSDSLLRLLHDCGYRVTTLDGQPVTTIDAYGEILAQKTS